METKSSDELAEHCRRLEERLRIVSASARAFSEATIDSQRLLETIARRVAEVIQDYCLVRLVSDDGLSLLPAAMFDTDPEVLRLLREVFAVPFPLAENPVSLRVHQTGEPFFQPHVDLEEMRPPRTTPRHFELVQRIGIHSVLIVPMQVHGRVIGQLSLGRFRRESPPFDEQDLELAQTLADHAALAVSNSRLLVEARRESAARNRLAEDLRLLTEASQEFAATEQDYSALWQTVAQRLGALVGDFCMILPLSEDGTRLESTGAVYHKDPEVLAAAREAIQLGPRIAEGYTARVAATGKPILHTRIETADYPSITNPRYRAVIERIGVISAIAMPLLCRGKVIGVATLLRGRGGEPYGEREVKLVQGVADHAALAIANARSYAAEQVARKAAEQTNLALGEAKSRFARLSESGVIGILVNDLSGRVFEVNDALAALVGYRRDELISGRVSWSALTPPGWQDVDTRAIGQLNALGVAGLREKEYLRKDGSRVPVLVGSAMLAGDGNVCISFVLDLTERQQAESARRDSELRLRSTLDSMLEGYTVIGRDWRYLYVNAAGARHAHLKKEEMIGRSPLELFPGFEQSPLYQALHRCLLKQEAGQVQEEFTHVDGNKVWFELNVQPVPEGMLILSIEATERKRAERALEALKAERAADARFRELLETAPDAMVIANEDGVIEFVNGQAERLFGYPRAELIGQPVELLVPEQLRAAHHQHREDFFKKAAARSMGKGLELNGRRKDGAEFPVEISLSPLKTERGLLVSSAIRDVSERKRDEQQKARLAAIVDASDDAIIGKTLEGVVTSWNRGAEKLFGYSASEMVGRPISTIVPQTRESEEPVILATAARGEVKRFDTVRRCKDGREIQVAVTVSPIRELTGRVVGISKLARDITERVEAEQSLSRAKLAAEAAGRELEAFSYSVAHDLRAPLRGMNGFARILLEDYGGKLDVDGQDCLQEIQGNALKMGALIDALLSLSRVTRSDWKPERVDLSALFRVALAQLAASDPSRSVTGNAEEGLVAEADVQLARTLFDNLVGNAWKFTARAPAAQIEFGATQKNGARALFIKDNGAGFDMAYANKLFAPFQRLHSVAEFPGTGIGLATVQRIVHRHGGRIWAEGKVGEGATFFFTLGQSGRGAT